MSSLPEIPLSVYQELEVDAQRIMFRQDRNSKLFQTDFLMVSDFPMTDDIRTEWKIYRQSLRDLPEKSPPTVKDNIELIVIWPTPPIWPVIEALAKNKHFV